MPNGSLGIGVKHNKATTEKKKGGNRYQMPHESLRIGVKQKKVI